MQKCIIHHPTSIIILKEIFHVNLQAPLIEYQENLLDWYVPYGVEQRDEEEIFQP